MKISKIVFSILTVLGTTAAINASAQTNPSSPPAAGTSNVSGAPSGHMKRHGFAALDINGDGSISREEAAARPMLAKMFDKLDTNKDGVLSKDEMKAAKEKMKARHMSKMDTDGDGRISRAEATAHPKLAENFDRIDTNGDGFLSKDELRAAHQARRAR